MAWFDFLNQANARGRDAGSIARQRLNARAAAPAVNPQRVPGLGLISLPYLIPGFGEQQVQNREEVLRMSQGPLNELNYIGGQLSQGRIPYAGSSIQNRPVVNPELNRPDFSGTGERDRRFQEYKTGRNIPGANTDYSARLAAGNRPTGADLAQAAETSRIAQLTAQNPELQRYEAARAAAAKSGDQAQMDSARDIGMQMWAKANPTLAAKVKPGQSGYEAIQNQINAGQMGSPMELGAFTGTQPTDLLFNPSSPLRSAPQTGGTDYTQVVPAAMPGAGGVMGNYFNNQQQAKMFSRFQQAAPAQTGMNPGLAPGSPYAQATAAAGGATYAGAAGVQPVGSSLTQGANPFASEKARLQAEEFKKRALSMQQ